MTLSTAKHIFAAIGLAGLLVSLVEFVHTASFVRNAARAQGTVTALERELSNDNFNTNGSLNNPQQTRYAYLPVVQFRYGAQQIQFSGSVATNPPAYHVGERVNVLYLESDPYNARIESFLSLWLNPLLFFGGGTIFVAFGTGMIFGSRADAAAINAR